jgi:hypothetical protein
MTLTQLKPSYIESVSAYKTSDGRLFASLEEAEDHQWVLDMRPAIEAHCFKNKCGNSNLQRHAFNVILHWERCKRKGMYDDRLA